MRTVQITGFNPTNGPVDTRVTLSLTDMPSDASINNTTVLLSGSPTVDVTAVDTRGSTINVTILANSQSGDFEVTVQSPTGPVSAQSSTVFTVNATPGAAQITGMQPRTAVRGQTPLTLTGQNLNQIKYLRIGNVNVLSLQHLNSEMVRVTVPAAVQPGQQRVTGQTQDRQVNCPYMLTVQ
ncbi:IPT/TIG domain-containing protein (plasmid) [Streptomyces sp. NBC_00841]|uniref:IPT/TIG domain-containing protein n=1 Tax=Streptomyces sp. NBC_00841 TaxID=2975847 RepID=UPI002DD9B81A|nr:IPT/TIG domain-containing protein [Streptomyces sp. NBC_00841]WSA05067.1 IPT/TIG domain-containing protein [Streptomyces sp. NBC_00841]